MNVFFPADGYDDTDAYDGAQAGDAWGATDESQQQAQNNEGADATTRRLSLHEVKQRDDLLRASILQLKMTAPQILKFSKVWEHPFYSESDVWRRAKAIKLDKRVKHVAMQSLHDEWTIRIFLKLAIDAAHRGFVVSEVSKEHRIGEKSSIRADMRMRIGDRLFYIETQHSALTYKSWKAKLTKYLNYYRRRQGPFRVLIVMENESNLSTVRRYAREVMGDRTGTLFLFAWMPDLLGQHDTVMEDVWVSHRHEPVALMR